MMKQRLINARSNQIELKRALSRIGREEKVLKIIHLIRSALAVALVVVVAVTSAVYISILICLDQIGRA